MTSQPESRLQRRCQTRIREEFPGAYVRKIHVSEFQSGGIADLLCCIDGFFVAIEIKMPGEEEDGLSELQKTEAKAVDAAGGITFVASSPQECVDKIYAGFTKRTKQFLGKLSRDVERATTSRAKARR